MPTFVFGLLLLLLFSLTLRWVPAFGGGDLSDVGGRLSRLVLPAMTLGVIEATIIARFTRSAMIDVLREAYIATARAKGLRTQTVIVRHALRNASITIVTVVGLQATTLLGGVVLTETVFARPGVGRLLVDAVSSRSYSAVGSLLALIAIGVVLINLLVDITYSLLNPRLRPGQ
jgi:peptide/nickel transport system permease protein